VKSKGEGGHYPRKGAVSACPPREKRKAYPRNRKPAKRQKEKGNPSYPNAREEENVLSLKQFPEREPSITHHEKNKQTRAKGEEQEEKELTKIKYCSFREKKNDSSMPQGKKRQRRG